MGWEVANFTDPEQSGSSLVVNKSDDHYDGSCTESDCSLGEAILSANFLAGVQTITFNIGAGNQQITLKNKLVEITDPLIIQGPTSQRIAVSGNNAFRVFDTSASLTLQNLSVVDGAASGRAGGGLYARMGTTSRNATVSISNCTFSGNSAAQGGGVYMTAGAGGISDNATLNITGSTFTANHAETDGAAVLAMSGDSGTHLTVNMSGCTVSGNTSSDWGAGFYLWQWAGNATAFISNCTFSGNSAANNGGAFINYAGGSLTVDSVTVTGNTASLGAAASLSFYLPYFSSRNSIYAGNISTNGGDPIFGEAVLVSQGYNLFSHSQDGFTETGDRKNLTTLTSTLGPLSSNGGPTKTHALLSGSPALNAGSTLLLVDQRGWARPKGSAADSGAYEVSGSNSAPTISTVANQSIEQGASTGPIGFSVGDAESSATQLMLSAASSNTTLIPQSNIVLGGTGTDRTISIKPAASQMGTSIVTITVSDGLLSASRSFTMTVTSSSADAAAPSASVTFPADGAVLR